MRVKLTSARGGPAGVFEAGDEIEVSDKEARRLIAADKAVPVRARKSETTRKKRVAETADKNERAGK